MDPELPEDQVAFIDGSPFVKLTNKHYERLLRDARSSEKSLSIPPQDLNLTIPHEECRSHVVLFAEDYLRLESEILPRENISYEKMPRKGGVFARAYWEQGGGMWLLKGSEIAQREELSCPENAQRRRKELERDGALVSEDGTLVLTRDCYFENPSLAACVARGNSANGNDTWVDADGKTLAQRGLGSHR